MLHEIQIEIEKGWCIADTDAIPWSKVSSEGPAFRQRETLFQKELTKLVLIDGYVLYVAIRILN